MPKTVTTVHTTDLALRRLEVIPTAAGYRVIVHAHVIDAVDGHAVSSADTTYNGDVANHDTTTLFKEVDAILTALRARDFS